MSVFEITVQRKAEDGWPVVVRHEPGAGELTKWSRGRLKLDLEALEPQRPADRAYGLQLGKALFGEDVQDAFVRALAQRTGDELLRVLLIVEADDLRSLRWEKLQAPLDQGWDYLLLNQGTPFSLYLPCQIERRFPPIGRRDLQALVMVAGPEDLDGDYGIASFDVRDTVMGIQGALGKIPCKVLAPVEGASGKPTLDVLCEYLIPGGYTILHIVCHGAFRQDSGETILYFPRDDRGQPVPATELIDRLNRLDRLPHLALLSTCESASPRAEAGLGGLGQRLVRELGMPAVLAMTDRISIATARALAGAFYARLDEHGEVDRALSEALVGLQGRVDVTVPALFSRLGERALFSDALDQTLTEAEIDYGLQRMQGLLDERAPVLLAEFKARAADIQATHGAHPEALSVETRHERQAALRAINQLCSGALDLSFNALALGQKPPDYDARCPFRGLYPFRAEDHEFFFGREALVETLSRRLKEHNFLCVQGPSGCGKSSLVLAGLVPALRERERGLEMAYLTPGSEPLDQLKAALARDGGEGKQPSLVVVDQFEELFTLCRDEMLRRQFVKRLMALSSGSRVVVTMRADFWGKCAGYPELKGEMQAHQELVAPLGAVELRAAMERQADHVGLRFEAGLGEAVFDDIQGEPGAMPLLQHALLLLWTRRHGRWLRWEEYRTIGGIQQAIAHTADKVYDRLSKHEQARVRDIFVRLTRLGGEPTQGELHDTRRRVPLSELVPAGSDPAETTTLVKRLADARLLVTSVNSANGQDEAEVAHEALIRHWPRLRDWLEKDRAELSRREKLRDAALDWKKHSKRDAYLIHLGERLENAAALGKQSRYALNVVEQDYLNACEELQKRQAEEQTAARRQERKASRLLRGLVALLVLLALVYPGFRVYQHVLRVMARGEMVPIPGGPVTLEIVDLKSADSKVDALSIEVTAFQIERFEVSNRQYSLCARALVCEQSDDVRLFDAQDRSDLPVVTVNAFQAATYCRWLGRRLPTEAEWQLSAQGAEGRPWPWGATSPSKELANVKLSAEDETALQPVGSLPGGATPEGVYQLAGNVMEWTCSDYGAPETCWDGRPGDAPEVLTVRGSSWMMSSFQASPSTRQPARPDIAIRPDLGFRCVQGKP